MNKLLLAVLIVYSLSITRSNRLSLANGKYIRLKNRCRPTWRNLESILDIPKIRPQRFREDKKICNSDRFSCCSLSLENKLVKLSGKENYDVVIKERISGLKFRFIYFSSKLDPIIQEVLQKSRSDFERTFNKSFPRQFTKNPLLFAEFFDGLKSYYREYPINIKKIIRTLFVDITMVMLDFFDENASSKSKLDKIDEKCIEENFETIEPFGQKIGTNIEKQLIKSVEAVKLFTIGITKIRNMIIELYSKLENPSINCLQMLTKLTKCSKCMPLNNDSEKIRYETKPCIHSCLHIYNKCIGLDLNQLNPIWNSYLDLMKKYSWHIEYSINFENSINQLKFQVSDAIIYFKSNSNSITAKFKEKCKKQRITNSFKQHQRKKKQYDSNKPKLTMHQFFTELNRYLYNLNGFWHSLLPNICKSISAHHENCWNTTHIIPQSSGKIDDTKILINYKNISNSNHQNSKFNRTFHRQLESLKQFNEQLRKDLKINNLNHMFGPAVVKMKKNEESAFKQSPNLNVEGTKEKEVYDYDNEYEYEDYYDKDLVPSDYEYIDMAYNYEYDEETSPKLRPIFYNSSVTAITPLPNSYDKIPEYFDYPTDNDYSSDYTYYYEDDADLKTLKQNTHSVKASTSMNIVTTTIKEVEESHLDRLKKFLFEYYFKRNSSIATTSSYVVIASSVAFVLLYQLI